MKGTLSFCALALLPAAIAFAPAAQRTVVRTVRFEGEAATEAPAEVVEEAVDAPAPAPAPVVTAINGWTPDSKVYGGREQMVDPFFVVHLFCLRAHTHRSDRTPDDCSSI